MELPPRSKRSTRVRTGSRYKHHPALPFPPIALLIILIVSFSVVILGGFYWLSARMVTLVLDGTRQDVRTFQPTVSALLAELQVYLEPQDIVAPSGNTPIRNGLIITIDKAHPVIVEADGQSRRVLTHAIQPRDILKEAGVSVGPRDLIRVDQADLRQESYTVAPGQIQVVRALAVRLDVDGTPSTVHTARRTVGEALRDAGISLHLADVVTPDPGTPLTDGSQITVRRSVAVTVLVDGRTLETRTHGKTVYAALAEIGIALVGLDFVVPDGGSPIKPGMTIRVVRVAEEDVVERVPVDFKQVERPDPTLSPGTRQVIQQGIPGIAERRIRIRREDGVPVSQSSPEIILIQKPRDEITAVGTLATPDP